MQNIEILRMDMSQAVDRFPDASLDFIYLDGNHTYEYVLRDLYGWFPKLSKGGLFVCNDFYESSTAAKQNLGVIPAFITFAKRHSAYPIALTSSDWSDLYFSNAPTSPMIEHLRARIFRSPFPVVELPDGLLGSYRHGLLEPAGHPPRWIPSFDLRGAP
jgi:hypothetical protein